MPCGKCVLSDRGANQRGTVFGSACLPSPSARECTKITVPNLPFTVDGPAKRLGYDSRLIRLTMWEICALCMFLKLHPISDKRYALRVETGVTNTFAECLCL